MIAVASTHRELSDIAKRLQLRATWVRALERDVKHWIDITTSLYGHLMTAAKQRTEKAPQIVGHQ